MRKLFIITLLSLLTATGLWSQTTVTGNAIQDSNGNLYATFQDQNGTQHSATVSAFLVVQAGAIPRVNNVPINPALGPFPMDSTGSFSIIVTPNSIIVPSGSQWQFTICGTSVNLGPQPTPLLQVCFNTALITVVSSSPQDITTQANAAAKLLGPKLGGGGGGGSGTVGPGTPGTFAGFVSSNQVGNTDCTFNGITPDRCPNGLNTAASGDHDEWTVGVGGTIAGRTVCVAGNRLVATCAAGATSGFIGIADSTQASGNQVSVCWAARCNVYSTNNTTTGDWFILSTSIAGGMDDVGAAKPTTGVQTFPVDSTVLAGQQALTTLLSPDSLNSMASGLGTINVCGPGLAYYPSLGNVINCIPNPTVPASVPQSLTAIPGGTPGFVLSGIPPRVVSGTSDTITCTDRAPGIVYYTSSIGASIIVPDVGSSNCWVSSPVFGVLAANTTGGKQTFTFTRQTASTITTCNGATCTTGTSFSLTTGQFATFSTSDNVNWTVRVNSNPIQTTVITNLAPAVGDDGLILVIDPASNIHLTRFACGVQGSTSVVVNMLKGGNSLITDQTCTNGSVETVTTSTFVNGSGQCGGTASCAIASHAPVTLHIGTITGTPTALQVSVEYTVD